MSQQFELFDIANPCIGVCQSNQKGYCFGCLRNRTERQLWLSMTNEQRREVLRLIAGRKQRLMLLRQQKQMALDFDELSELIDLF